MRVPLLIDQLMENHPAGFDLSLDRILELLNRLDNPQDRIPPAIHVAGTNGKGSTIAACRALLEAAGKSVHVHTSPHLVNWTERYRLGTPSGGKLVSDDVLADAIEHVSAVNEGRTITVFEILSAVMFVLFSEHPADYSLVEVGLGGRLDATNVIPSPLVSVITPVDLDHQGYLGDTIGKIAFEKAGIIKPGRPVVVGIQHDDARSVIEARASELKCPILIQNQDFQGYRERDRFIYQDNDGLFDLPLPSLPGEHQIENAATAIASLKAGGIPIDQAMAEKGMQSISWPARLQRLPEGRIVEKLGRSIELWLDGGHNPHAGAAISDHLQRTARPGERITMICAMLTTKDPAGYFAKFGGLVDQVITIPITSSSAGIEPQVLAQAATSAGLTAKPASSLEDALAMLECGPSSPDRVLFAGSLYLAGDVLAFNGTPPQ